jgi:hypothetical protein
MLKPSFRLHTRACGWKQTIIALDVTRRDFHSGPLELYVTHWFIDVDDLIDYLITSTDDSIILIVSNLLADITKHVLCRLLPQISEVYILGPYLRKNFTDMHDSQRFLDVELLLHTLVHKIEPKIITHKCYSSERSVNDLTEDAAKYIWYQFFFDVLSHLKNTNVARSEMLKTVRAFHPPVVENYVSQNCEEFESNYKPQDVIRWYTRTSFFYIALNRTLRSENIEQIFTFRYVISDLVRSLNELEAERPFTEYTEIYRGQKMYLDEIKSIGSKVGHLIGMTTFWPATFDSRNAYCDAISSFRYNVSVEPVVFTIKKSNQLRRFTCVNISHLSSFERSQQLIFPPRSLFRVEGIKKIRHVWQIDLTLVDETDDQLIQTMHFWKTSLGLRNFFSLSMNQNKTFSQNLSDDNAAFLRFQLLIDIILRLNHNDFAKSEMLEMCKAKFASNSVELAKIDIFEKIYVDKNAIAWYTKDCFLYRLLNESLQSESIDVIVKLRYFIYDLHNQLAELHSHFLRSLPPNQPMLELYRGLKMTMSELEKFRQNENAFVSTNSFLSTTRDYQAALFFAGEGKVEEPQVSVIYEIFVDTSIAHSIPFAAIEYNSIYMDEDEVLFSMAAVFRIGKTEKLDDRLWKIKLTLTPTIEERWNMLTAHLKK